VQALVHELLAFISVLEVPVSRPVQVQSVCITQSAAAVRGGVGRDRRRLR
jgi:hypothetical protein